MSKANLTSPECIQDDLGEVQTLQGFEANSQQ